MYRALGGYMLLRKADDYEILGGATLLPDARRGRLTGAYGRIRPIAGIDAQFRLNE